MARSRARKNEAHADTATDGAHAATTNGTPAEPAATTNGHAEPAGEYKLKPTPNFSKFVDHHAGVKLRHDRRNRLFTISFREAPPEAAVEKLLAAGYAEDPEINHRFGKKVNHLRPGDSHDQAQALAHEVENLVRAEKGLPEKQSYFVSRG